MAGPALGTPHQSASATPQSPASMDQPINPLFCGNWNGISQGNQQQNTPSVSLNASQFGSQQQFAQGMQYTPAMSGNSQAQQMTANSSFTAQNANIASAPLVVSSQMFRRPSSVTQRSSATPQMANSGVGSLTSNQSPPMPNAQPLMGNSQGQYMQPSFSNAQYPMAMDNMYMMQNGIGGMQHPFMGNSQASFMGNAQPHHLMGNFQPAPMRNSQAQFTSGFMSAGAPNSFMGYGQPQTQFMANMQASHMGTGQSAAHNMSMPYGNMPGNFQNMQPMSNVQPYGHISGQRAQGFQLQTPSPSLNAAAPSFFPTQGDTVSQQQAAPQANMPLQPQMGMMQTPRAAPMAMQTSPQTNGAAQKSNKKRTTKRSGATKADNAPKRRNKPVNNTFMQKANNSTRARTPGMGKVMDRLGDIARGETLPPNVGGDMDMTPRPMPKHQVFDYLRNPAEHPTIPQDYSTEQLTQQHLMTPPPSSPVEQLVQQSAQQPLQLPDSSQALYVGEISSQSGPEEHTSPPTQPQLNAVGEPSAASKGEENKPPVLTKKEKWLRQAEAEGRTIPPSRRRVVRIERDDPRLVLSENGQLISPKSNMYTGQSCCASFSMSTDTDHEHTVYYVPPIGEISPDMISRDLMDFLLQKMNPENAAENNAKTNGKKTTKKASKSRSEASTDAVGEKNGGQKLTENPTGEVTVSERLNTTAAATTTDASEPFTVNPFDPTLSSTIQDAPMEHGYGSQFTSEPTAEPANTAIAACNDVIDPALTEPAELQQDQHMPKVSDDLTSGSMEQPAPATTEVSSNEEFMMSFAQLQQFNAIAEDGPGGSAFLTAPESSTASPTSAETESSVGNHNIARETPESDLFNGSSIDKPNGSPSEMADAPPDVGMTLPEAESSLEGDITSSESPKSDTFSLLDNIPSGEPDEFLFDVADAHKSFEDFLGDDAIFFTDDKSVSGHATSSYASCLEEPVPGLFNTDPTDPANAHLVNKADHLRNDLASGNNDVSVHPARLANEPSMRLADMPYSPICSPTYPFAEMSYPPRSPVFEPMDPYNTVLGQYAPDKEDSENATEEATKNSDAAEKTTTGTTATATDTTTATTTATNTNTPTGTKKRKASEDTGAVPNKKARTTALTTQLVFPQSEVRHGPAGEQ
ncbi:hypothetical protein FLAG1_02000 [Fusarium langsethiae]|uniref:Uncharacterized protein n=1 Tax=Fusarium langsethiae TaxID=179993 RepID=A0A0N0DH43_FUSLA|nr:hypothetical protein FLAG1_02000 [Fusarium langsethiae]GKU05033.1 unnamed protein product [Fusarium langsethiae]GKU11849.1 unnamed protein product [Fusarium langsethiae]